ncbi:hypothetical protein [Rhizobium mongolense]
MTFTPFACKRSSASVDDATEVRFEIAFPMFHSLRQIRARPQLLLLAFMIFVQGSAYGSTLPYLSVSAVTISVSLGILSDLIGDRRRIMIAMALMGAPVSSHRRGGTKAGRGNSHPRWRGRGAR